MSLLRRAGVGVVSLAATATGGIAVTEWRRRRRADHRAFVLEYHEVSGGPECEGTVSAARLRRHIRALKRRYRFDTVSSLAERLACREGLQEDLLALTFDDGLCGNYRWAWPVLREERVPATIFLTTGFLDGADLWFDLARRGLVAAARAGDSLARETRSALEGALGRWPGPGGVDGEVNRLKYLPEEARERLLSAFRDSSLPLEPAACPMTWDQVREMEEGGVEMGCHTVTHPILSTLSPADQEREILGSRDRVSEELGKSPASFAMPNGARGDFDRFTLEILKSAGFRAACTTIRGSNRHGGDSLQLRRIGIGSDCNLVVKARLSSLFDQEARDRFSRRGEPVEMTRG